MCRRWEEEWAVELAYSTHSPGCRWWGPVLDPWRWGEWAERESRAIVTYQLPKLCPDLYSREGWSCFSFVLYYSVSWEMLTLWKGGFFKQWASALLQGRFGELEPVGSRLLWHVSACGCARIRTGTPEKRSGTGWSQLPELRITDLACVVHDWAWKLQHRWWSRSAALVVGRCWHHEHLGSQVGKISTASAFLS